MVRRIAPFRDFLKRESSSGIILLIAAILGLLAANSPISENYHRFLEIDFTIDFAGIFLEMTVLKLINYGLMTIFFFVVGLEIKREISSGHLSKLKQAAAPFFAAIGGMAVPALIYLAIAGDVAPEGWAIPVATDIALAVGVLALMGSTVTQELKEWSYFLLDTCRSACDSRYARFTAFKSYEDLYLCFCRCAALVQPL
ncbi:MAG: hypothetical protein EBX19_06375 [Actinobacteria bacterium]|nr:hypothetical protein [Actinomycetota bacterium]